jgi:hypothetical protein
LLACTIILLAMKECKDTTGPKKTGLSLGFPRALRILGVNKQGQATPGGNAQLKYPSWRMFLPYMYTLWCLCKFGKHDFHGKDRTDLAAS